MFLDLYRRLNTNKSGRPAKKRGRNPWKARLSMELLETRLTPASIWTVTTLSDNPVHTGLSLRDAIIDANGTPGSTVKFASTLAGTIQLQQGDLDITAVMTIDGSTSKNKNITIDANSKDRVFDISTPGTVTLKNLTIKDGVAPTTEGCGDGGGIYSSSKLSSLTLINDNILNNKTGTSRSGGTGVMDSGGGVFSNGGVSLINTIVNKNTANELGGGVYAVTKLIVTNNSLIENNVASSGGGLYLAGTGSTVTITGSRVIQNQAVDGDGGGVWAEFNVNATSSTIDANTATNDGGGIFSNHGNVYLSSTTHVDGNMAGANGGGIWAFYTVLVRSGSTVDNNTAGGLYGGNGGGIYSKNGFVRVDGSGSEVDGNQAKDPPIPTGVDPGNGGGIWSGGDVFVQSGGAVDDNTANGNGGGIYALGNVAVILGSEVDGNTAITPPTDDTAGNGGGIWAEGDVVVQGSDVSSNNAGLNGGGIYQPCNPCQHNTYIEDGSTVDNNNAANDGGGIWNEGGQVNVEGCSVIDSNTADHDGGGIYSVNGVLYIDESSITNNTAGNNGGGVWVGIADDGTDCAETCPGVVSVTITTSSFIGNTAGNDGGGLFAFDVLNLAVSDSEFSDNTAQSGDGGAMAITGCGDFSIDDTTFARNSASEFGGAIYTNGVDPADTSGGGMTGYLDHNTFNENVAFGGYGTGCDLYADDGAYVIIVNNLFADTTGLCKLWNNDLIDSSSTSKVSDFDNDSDGDDSVEGASGSANTGTVNSEGSNLVADNSGSNVQGFSNLIGDIADGLQGLTYVPGSYGTAGCHTGYYKLKKSKIVAQNQAIKGGDNEGPYLDQIGHTRPTDGSPSDIGAVQFF